jgi:hypothetical protein
MARRRTSYRRERLIRDLTMKFMVMVRATPETESDPVAGHEDLLRK